ncbi:MAG: AzlD domain-containing protein [Deltaproteobacteria bacterium]|nr:AzlD domain-containing protein [Deltaproteobacteria bacterium]
MIYWLAVLIIGLGSFLYRLSFLSGRLKPPRFLALGLEFVPVSALAALVASGFFLDAEKNLSLSAPVLLAVLTAGLAAWRWRRDLLTIGLGLAVYGLADYFCS